MKYPERLSVFAPLPVSKKFQKLLQKTRRKMLPYVEYLVVKLQFQVSIVKYDPFWGLIR